MFRKTVHSLAAKSIYDFQVNGGDHKPYDLKKHQGSPLLIMNVASHCGLTTGGYEAATTLYDKYKGQGFTVLAFPCNQFGGQEPGTEAEIKEMVCTRFKAEFPIMEKVDVNGEGAHPLFKFLKESQKGLLGSTAIKWNFTSFLVDGSGVPVARYAPGPKTSTIEKDLVPLLKKKSDAKL